MLVSYTYTDNPSHFASTWCSPWNICCHSLHSSPEMSRDETTSTNLGSISNIFHFMSFTPPLTTRTYACTMQICHSPKRNFVYAAQIFHMGISEGIFVFCCFLSLVLVLYYFIYTDIPNKVDPKKEEMIWSITVDTPWDRGDFNLAITGNTPVSATTDLHGRSRGTIRIVVKLVVSHKY